MDVIITGTELLDAPALLLRASGSFHIMNSFANYGCYWRGPRGRFRARPITGTMTSSRPRIATTISTTSRHKTRQTNGWYKKIGYTKSRLKIEFSSLV